mgnify:FL=1
MSDVETGKKKVRLAPHLALTSPMQGGAANGRNVSLVLKSEDVLKDPHMVELLKAVFGETTEGEKEEVEKSTYNFKRVLLEDAVKKFKRDKYDWHYVRDFDEEFVVFSIEGEVFYAPYTISEAGIEVGQPVGVTEIISYIPTNNTIKLSTEKLVQDAPKELIVKCKEGIESEEYLLDIFKSKYQQEEQKKMEDIQKAVEAKDKELQDVLKTVAELQSELEVYKAKEKEQVLNTRREMLKSVRSDEAEVETLLKSLEGLDEDGFKSVVEVMKADKEKLESSDLFKSVSGEGEEVVKSSNTNFDDVLKSKVESL